MSERTLSERLRSFGVLTHEELIELRILEAKLEALGRDLKNARIFLAERDEKLERQAEQITRLETGQVSLRLTLTSANELITRLCDAYLDDQETQQVMDQIGM